MIHAHLHQVVVLAMQVMMSTSYFEIQIVGDSETKEKRREKALQLDGEEP